MKRLALIAAVILAPFASAANEITCPKINGQAPANTMMGPYRITVEGNVIQANFLPDCATVRWIVATMPYGLPTVLVDEDSSTYTVFVKPE